MTTVNPSGKTSDFEVTYAVTTDAPTSVPVFSKAMAERVNAIFKSFKGDATLATDGTLTAKDHSVSLFQAAAVTRTSAVAGAFTSPVVVELPKVKANQLIEVRVFGTTKCSIESGFSTGGTLRLAVSGMAGVSETLFGLNQPVEGKSLPANTVRAFTSVANSALVGTLTVQGRAIPLAAAGAICWVAESEATGVKVELQGSSTSGTITVESVYLAARVSG